VLLAVVDAEYRFLYVDVSYNGRVSDGGVFNRCSLYHALQIGTVELPPAIPLPGLTQPVPYFCVADDVFAMRNYIMKPYPFKDQPAPNQIFNYQLSRACRIVDVFGIIANRFRVLRGHCKYCASSLCSAQLSDVNTGITLFLSTAWIT